MKKKTSKYTVDVNDIEDGMLAMLSGKLYYSKLSRKTTAEELANENTRRKYPVTKPYTNVSIYEARILPKNGIDEKTKRPNAITTLETYIYEHFYEPKSEDKELKGPAYSALNKGKELTPLFKRKVNEDGSTTYVPYVLPKDTELAVGTPVRIVIRAYDPGNGNNNGITLEKVLIEEETPKFYGKSSIDDELSAWGVTFDYTAPAPADSNSEDDENEELDVDESPFAEEETPFDSDDEDEDEEDFGGKMNKPAQGGVPAGDIRRKNKRNW